MKSIKTILNTSVGFNFEEWRTAEIDPFTQQPLKYEISKVYDEDQKIEIKGTEFIFNYIKYSYDTVISEQETNPISVERLKNTNGAIVIYTNRIRTQYLVDRARGASGLPIRIHYQRSPWQSKSIK